VSLDQLLAAKAGGALESIAGSQVFLALLSMVGSTPEAINEISTSEQLISKLEAVETRLSKKVFKYWSQNRHLKVRFRFDQASAGDPAPFHSGKVFQTRIENTRHEATIRLDERSTGFIWFFSFLVWFSEVQKQFGDNLVVLLDEPGLTLHARAQEDLLRYIRENCCRSTRSSTPPIHRSWSTPPTCSTAGPSRTRPVPTEKYSARRWATGFCRRTVTRCSRCRRLLGTTYSDPVRR